MGASFVLLSAAITNPSPLSLRYVHLRYAFSRYAYLRWGGCIPDLEHTIPITENCILS